MKTIGEVLRNARQKKRYSRQRLEEVTKIKKEFIEALENENWQDLPEYPVVQGFVKNIAGVLKVNPRQPVALLRRDYPPKKLAVNPKPDLNEQFRFSPKITFFLGAGLVTLVIIAYLVFQYLNFIKPPQLQVTSPVENQLVQESDVAVVGKTDPEATIRVNNQPVLIQEDGSFSVMIPVSEETEAIIIEAVSRSGKETILHRKIRTDF